MQSRGSNPTFSISFHQAKKNLSSLKRLTAFWLANRLNQRGNYDSNWLSSGIGTGEYMILNRCDSIFCIRIVT